MTRRHSLVMVGEARLDNREDILRLTNEPCDESDLCAILGAYDRNGAAVIPQLHGDFAFVLWDGAKQEFLAVRDCFGVKRLFWTTRDNAVLVSSELDALYNTGTINEAFVWSFLSARDHDPAHTIWSGVEAIRPASYLSAKHGTKDTRVYWRPGNARPVIPTDEREQTAVFAAHLQDAIRSRMRSDDSVWCELSGGLDSTSVFAFAEKLFGLGQISGRVAGTYSFVDEMPGADERRFLDSVLASTPIPNKQLVNSYPWQEDNEPPPRTDEPHPFFPFWARDRASEQIVHDAGGTVILSGGGSDYYLTGSPFFVADSLSRFEIASAIADARELALAFRGSMWRILWRYGVRPLINGGAQSMADVELSIPPWITANFIRTSDASRPTAAARVRGPNASFSLDNTTRELSGAASLFELPVSSSIIEKRYPFFARPLVDFALALPPNMMLRGGTTKWVLRQATHRTIPEIVRTRRSKGWIDGRIAWALSQRAPLFVSLLRDPLIAQAGWVDADKLRSAVEMARSGLIDYMPMLFRALALETWLVVRERQWPDVQAPSNSASGGSF
ncbi:MAG: asparagine synthase-related protein [Gemmatimonadaceae bacterium]